MANMQQAIVQQAIEHSVLAAAKQMEDQLDSQLKALENMDEDDLDNLRQKRIDQLKLQAKQKKEWLAKGHGEYREIFSDKEFFSEMKGEDRLICHFFRENWPCKVMDKHLAILAQQHLETKFIKINAEKSPYLTEKLKIWMLPTLALVKKEKVLDYVVGFDDLGGKDDFSTEVLAGRLAAGGVIHPDETAAARKPTATQRNVRQGGVRSRDSDDEDSDFD
ncbi:hypothetical protein WJX72_011883 [[Myrmecia] bisecta]|uniref:Thioredoxin domain-containing protein n=1 Tax=[Myrmecia] bisecta TaxID=41462 RepID=A0AAW1PU47_9CHLO